MHPFVLGYANFPEDLACRGAAFKMHGQYLVAIDKNLDVHEQKKLLKVELSQILLGHFEAEFDGLSFCRDADMLKAWDYAEKMTDIEFAHLMEYQITTIDLPIGKHADV